MKVWNEKPVGCCYPNPPSSPLNLRGELRGVIRGDNTHVESGRTQKRDCHVIDLEGIKDASP
jgi:hypothetical protein